MKLQSFQVITGASLLALTDMSIACGTVPSESSKDKGNYYCADCAGYGIEERIFISTTVNQNVQRWVPNQYVTITNGSQYTTMTYTANGTFIPTSQGNGFGPGTAVNHAAGSTTCTPPQNTGGGSTGGYYATDYSTPNYGSNPGYYQSTCMGCGSYGTVTIEFG